MHRRFTLSTDCVVTRAVPLRAGELVGGEGGKLSGGHLVGVGAILAMASSVL